MCDTDAHADLLLSCLCFCLVGTSQTVSSKHILIMDEVDGMAGNEDRGGIQVKKHLILTVATFSRC